MEDSYLPEWVTLFHEFWLQVTHVLNVACGVENAFPGHFIYKTVPMMDLPETELTSYLPQCFEFIDEAKKQVCDWITVLLLVLFQWYF